MWLVCFANVRRRTSVTDGNQNRTTQMVVVLCDGTIDQIDSIRDKNKRKRARIFAQRTLSPRMCSRNSWKLYKRADVRACSLRCADRSACTCVRVCRSHTHTRHNESIAQAAIMSVKWSGTRSHNVHTNSAPTHSGNDAFIDGKTSARARAIVRFCTIPTQCSVFS